jgi:GTPase
VADYPFTTIEPVLGTLERDGRQLVLADIPGLIEGASAGAGLGRDFLAHVERCRLLVHVLDLAPLDQSDPAANFATIEAEVRDYDPRLASLPRILALSKADLVAPEEAEAARRAWRERLGDVPVLLTSAATGQGLDELARELLRGVPPQPETRAEAPAAFRVFRPAAGRTRDFSVHRTGAHAFRVSGDGVDRLIARHDIENPDALEYLEQRLESLGVRRALEAAGFTPGDDVEIGGVVFELE